VPEQRKNHASYTHNTQTHGRNFAFKKKLPKKIINSEKEEQLLLSSS